MLKKFLAIKLFYVCFLFQYMQLKWIHLTLLNGVTPHGKMGVLSQLDPVEYGRPFLF